MPREDTPAARLRSSREKCRAGSNSAPTDASAEVHQHHLALLGSQLPLLSLLPTEIPHKHFGWLNKDTGYKDRSTGRCRGVAQEGRMSGKSPGAGWAEHSVSMSRCLEGRSKVLFYRPANKTHRKQKPVEAAPAALAPSAHSSPGARVPFQPRVPRQHAQAAFSPLQRQQSRSGHRAMPGGLQC